MFILGLLPQGGLLNERFFDMPINGFMMRCLLALFLLICPLLTGCGEDYTQKPLETIIAEAKDKVRTFAKEGLSQTQSDYLQKELVAQIDHLATEASKQTGVKKDEIITELQEQLEKLKQNPRTTGEGTIPPGSWN